MTQLTEHRHMNPISGLMVLVLFILLVIVLKSC